MIPAFPKFIKLDINDRADIESYTHRSAPYSDFNFTSLWAWDTSGERMVSQLNGNLAIRFTDYETGEPFYSFLGTNEPDRTARELIRYAEATHVSPVLRLVPEESVRGMYATALTVEEDKSNFDYIYKTSELAALQGSKFKGKRYSSCRFLREHPEVAFEIRNLGDTVTQKQITSVLRSWENKKRFENKECELQHEEAAINRLIETPSSHKLILSTLIADGGMLAFSIDEILPGRYCMGHFWKAANTHVGIYDYFIQNIALHLEAQGAEFWNCEQDLGIKNLRYSKMSYFPVKYLKKYTVLSANGEMRIDNDKR